MGIVGSLVGKAAVAVGKTVVKNGVETALVNAVDKSREKISQKLIEDEPNTHHLLLKPYDYSKVDKYTVFDVYEQPQYYVKKTETKLFLYDWNKNILGEVDKRTINKNQFVESEVKEYSFKMYGQYIGIMTSQVIKKRQKYKITFKDWHVSQNLIGSHFAILDKKNRTIAKTSGKGLAWNYDVISFPEKDNELLGLLVVLVINSNSED